MSFSIWTAQLGAGVCNSCYEEQTSADKEAKEAAEQAAEQERLRKVDAFMASLHQRSPVLTDKSGAQPLKWLTDDIILYGPDSQTKWERLCNSQTPRVAPFAMIWNAASLLAFAETTKVIVTIDSVSVVLAIVRHFRKSNEKLLWVEDSTRAITWAESACAKEQQYAPLAAQIIQRANRILAVTREEAQRLPCFQHVIENDAYSFSDPYREPMARERRRRSGVDGPTILQIVKSLTGNELLLEDVLSEKEWNAT